MLGVLDTVRDESSDQQAVRIMLEPKSSRLTQEEFMGVLLTHTSLEANVSINLTMMGLYGENGGRRTKKTCCKYCMSGSPIALPPYKRRTRHRLARDKHQIHILEGRMLVFLKIDEVIRCIREADDPRADLIAQLASPKCRPKTFSKSVCVSWRDWKVSVLKN